MNEFLAIDFFDDIITAVHVQKSSEVTLIKGYGVSSLTSSDNLQEAIQQVARDAKFDKGTCILAVGAEKCTFRTLTLPFTNHSQISQVLPFELQDMLSEPIADSQLDFLITTKEKNSANVLSALIAKRVVRSYLNATEKAHLTAKQIGISGLASVTHIIEDTSTSENFIYLDVGIKNSTCFIVKSKRVVLIRSFTNDPENLTGISLDTNTNSVLFTNSKKLLKVTHHIASQVQQTSLMTTIGLDQLEIESCYVSGVLGHNKEFFANLKKHISHTVTPYYTSNRPMVKFLFQASTSCLTLLERSLALAYQVNKPTNHINFRKGEFQKRHSFQQFKKRLAWSILPAVCLTIILIFSAWFDYRSLEKERKEIVNRIHQKFTETLPRTTKIVDPVRQLQIAIDQLQKDSNHQSIATYSQLFVLKEISTLLSPSLPVHITRFHSDAITIRIVGETDTYNNIDTMKKSLEKSQAFTSVQITSANLRQQSKVIQFELSMELAL